MWWRGGGGEERMVSRGEGWNGNKWKKGVIRVTGSGSS